MNKVASHNRAKTRQLGRRPRRGLYLIVLVLFAGCMRQYQPPQLPLFMRDDLAMDVAAPGTGAVPLPPADGEMGPEPRFLPETPEVKQPAARPVLTVSAQVPEREEELPSPRSLSVGLTLNEAIEACLRTDPKIRAGWEVIEQARADFATSSLLPNPQYFMDSQLNPLGQHWSPTRQGGPPQMDWYFNWPIDWYLSGRRAAEMASARLGADVSAADYADLVRQRIAAAISAYYDVLEARALLELAEQDLRNLKEVEGITAKRFKLGGIGRIEQDRVGLAVLASQRELRTRQTGLVTALANLRTLMGQPQPATDLTDFPVQGTLNVPVAAQPLPADEALKLAQDNRPDLASLEKQVAKAEADIQVQKTKCCPTVNPAFGFTHQFQRQAIGFPDARSWNVALTMSLPYFDRNQGNILKAQSVKAQNYYNLQAQLVSIRAEIEQAVQEFRVAHTNVVQDDPRLLKMAERVRAGMTEAYRVGGKTYLETLDAQRAYRDTYRLFITSQSNYWHSLNRVNAAIGKQVLR